MGTVAKCSVGTVLAAAEINRALFLGGVGHRGESGAFVGTVTKGLGFALSTGTPVVGFVSLNGDGKGGGLSDFWFFHNNFGGLSRS
jgi:hypothetical protein